MLKKRIPCVQKRTNQAKIVSWTPTLTCVRDFRKIESELRKRLAEAEEKSLADKLLFGAKSVALKAIASSKG